MNFDWMKTLARWLMPVLCVATLLLYGHAQYKNGFTEAQSIGVTALANLRLEHAIAEAVLARANEKSAQDAVRLLQSEQARSDRLAATLADQQRQNRTTTDRLSGEIARVNDLYREALDAPPKPLPDCVFTAGWVRVYDEATGAAVPARTNPGGAAATPENARAVEQLNSGISQSRLLAHHLRYAELCRNTATQLGLLIDQVTGK